MKIVFVLVANCCSFCNHLLVSGVFPSFFLSMKSLFLVRKKGTKIVWDVFVPLTNVVVKWLGPRTPNNWLLKCGVFLSLLVEIHFNFTAYGIYACCSDSAHVLPFAFVDLFSFAWRILLYYGEENFVFGILVHQIFFFNYLVRLIYNPPLCFSFSIPFIILFFLYESMEKK